MTSTITKAQFLAKTRTQGNTMTDTVVDKSQIPQPEITLSDQAWTQLILLMENDLTLKGKYFRLLISGKGCDGFSYSVGFTDWHHDDFRVQLNTPLAVQEQMKFESQIKEVEILMDPFTAFYLQICKVDYIQDFENNNEGFTVTNLNQSEYTGKFWKKEEEKVPPLPQN